MSDPAPVKQDEVLSAHGIELATEKQVGAVGRLIENEKVTTEEKRNIHSLIEGGLHKSKAKEILDYFYGQSELMNGTWEKTTRGALLDR